MRYAPILAAGAVALAGCSTVPGDGIAPGPGGECNAEGAQRFVGQKASADIGAQLLRTTGARQLRWVPPRTAVTMDFRPDRLTVSYDDAMTIERVSCG
ncbi:MAG: hypothetical protein B7Z08_04055 [Sphingomonadales bacterium 32-68-7]|nr:MAG: hypothetical protein B7Z33_13760 [Sphingomonadales bacterium 12-68-11]OYX09708.1 MAG: hypothetical protein B7Z08_04055 [Sphingomonadales bacterium 32-68-7]